MNTPLKCITRFAEDLIENLTDPCLVKTATLIRNTSKLLHTHVNELLVKTLLEKKMFIADLNPISLVSLVQECVSLMSN